MQSRLTYIVLALVLALLVAGVVLGQPAGGAVARADVASVGYVYFGGRWYDIALDFRARLYSCADPNNEHASWTGEIESWDARAATLVFREAHVICKPCDLPLSGPVSLVRLRFRRDAVGVLFAEAEGGSWGRCEVEFR